MTYIVGLTGGIGAGKSTVAEFFQQRGAPVIDADVIAKSLVEKGKPALGKIVEKYGASILTSKGELNRTALRGIIFDSKEDRVWLECLLHPSIRAQIQEQVNAVDYPYCIVVIPLLAQNYDAYKPMLDHVLLIETSEENQVARVQNRDKSTQALIHKMIQAQSTVEERIPIAHTILHNNGSVIELKEKVDALHQVFLQAK